MLLRLGVSAALVEAERREMNNVRVGKTASRVVLGSMTDFVCLMDANRNLEDIAMRLAVTPRGPLDMRHPADVALELMAGG